MDGCFHTPTTRRSSKHLTTRPVDFHRASIRPHDLSALLQQTLAATIKTTKVSSRTAQCILAIFPIFHGWLLPNSDNSSILKTPHLMFVMHWRSRFENHRGSIWIREIYYTTEQSFSLDIRRSSASLLAVSCSTKCNYFRKYLVTRELTNPRCCLRRRRCAEAIYSKYT